MIGAVAEPARKPGQQRPAPRVERISIRSLTKRYGNQVALINFNLDVLGGEFISLLGPSGCGKTTALNCIAGLVEADEGRVELDGNDLQRLPPEKRRFGMVFQNYALFPHLTVGRNVAFGLEMEGAGSRAMIARRVRDVLSLVRLEHLRDRYPAQLSGGQQQRVALARALVTEPRLILMDEPLSNLDAKLRLEMRVEIRRLHQALGLTTIYVTHDQQEALSLSDRIVLMRDGIIQQVGTPEEVYAEPQSAFVANFLGYRNLLPVTVRRLEADVATVVRPEGFELTGARRGNLEVGGPAVAAIRPEDIEVLSASGHDPSALEASIELSEFAGDAFELSAEVGSGVHLIARSRERREAGSAVALRLPPNRLLIFPREDG